MTKENKNLVSGGVGGVTGAGSAVTGVVLSGSTTALSGAGIVSGLAAVGSVVGGGMLAGLCVVAAAPIAGAAIGYGGYKLYQHVTA